ncbi:hypothetical protein V2O64_11645 [Verrucomicrobiaceae bacterium 227]
MSRLKSGVLKLLFLLTSILPAQDKGDLGKTLTFDQLRKGFACMANDHFAVPGSRFNTPRPGATQSWLDGVARLILSPKLEEEIVQFLKYSDRNVHQYDSPAIPRQDQRWLLARFYELRGRDQEALQLYLDQNNLNSRELIALARLQWRNQQHEESKAYIPRISEWEDFRLEAHVFTALGEEEDLPPFIDELRSTLPEATYIEHILPLELDLKFNAGEWKLAVIENEQRGPAWHLRTLHYYGEFAQFQRTLEQHEANGTPPNLATLLLYPISLTGRRIESLLMAGQGTRQDKLKALRLLSRHPTVIKTWFDKFPNEGLDLALELSPQFRPNPGNWETPLTLFLNQQTLTSGTSPHLAKLILVQRPMEARELLQFISTSPCDASFPDITHISFTLILDQLMDPEKSTLPSDPLLWILSAPHKYLPKEQVLAALESNPHFQNLSSAGKAKYYLFARINHRLLDKLLEIDWSKGQHLQLAAIANDNLLTDYLSGDQKHQKALWLTRRLAAYPKEQIPHRLERWAADLELLTLNQRQLQEIAKSASFVLSNSFEETPEVILTNHLSQIKTGPDIAATISRLNLDTPAQSAAELKDRLVRDHIIGGFLLHAAIPQNIARADRKEFYGVWQLDGFGQAVDLSNRALCIRGIEYIERIGSRHWTETGSQTWMELGANLSAHFNQTLRNDASSFTANWLFTRLKQGDFTTEIPKVVEAWDGELDQELRYHQTLVKNWENFDPSELHNFLAEFPPSYFASIKGSRPFSGRPTFKPNLLFIFEARKILEAASTEPQNPYGADDQGIRTHKQNEEREIEDWLTLQVESGRTLSSLAKSFRIYREGSNFGALGSLLAKLGTKVTKQDPDRIWKEEAMTYLETIDPGELLEAPESGPPLAKELATDPLYAQRYFDWAKGAGVPAVRTWGKIAQDCIEQGQPEIAFQWIDFALTQDYQNFADTPPFGGRSRYHANNSSRNSNIWTALASSDHLTDTANKLLGRLQPDLDLEIKLILATATDLPEWQHLLAKLLTGEDAQYAKPPVFNLTHTLKYGKNAQAHLTKFQQILAENPKLQELVDLEILLMDPTETDRSGQIKKLWIATKSKINLAHTDNRQATGLLLAALTEADDETFDLIMTDIEEGFSQFQWLSTWDGILAAAPLADPKRVHRLLNQFNRDEIYKRLRSNDQRGMNWSNSVSPITTAAYHANHAPVLQQILPDIREHAPAIYRSHRNDQLLHQLWAGLETKNALSFEIAREANQLSLSWTLTGGTLKSGSNTFEIIHPGEINALDQLYNLTFTAIIPGQPGLQIATVKQAGTRGTIKAPWNLKFAKGRIEITATRIIGQRTLKAQKAIPSQELATIEKPKHPGISSAPFIGPFGKTNAWKGSYLGTRGDRFPLEIASWEPQPAHEFQIEFWLWQGNVRTVNPTLTFYAPDSTILQTTELKLPQSGWFKVERKLTPTEIPEGTSLISLNFNPRSGIFGFTPPKYAFVKQP